jgi:hypothetical protein
MAQRKLAVLVFGGSFRIGGQGSLDVGSAEAFHSQRQATATHLDLMRRACQECNCACDVYVATLSTRYDADLLSWYAPHVRGSVFVPIESSHDGYLFRKARELVAENEEYEFLLFLRADLVIKPFMLETFKRPTCITFPSVCFVLNGYHMSRGHPRVSNMFVIVPRHLYGVLQHMDLSHDAWSDLVIRGLATHDDFDVWLSTFHDSDSFKDWNPLYKLCGRAESSQWFSRGLLFDRGTRGPREGSDATVERQYEQK